MKKLMTVMSILSCLIFLSACGSGGGGGGSSSAPSNGGGTGGGGGSDGSSNNGNASYYGFSTDSNSVISDLASAPAGGILLSITNEVAMNIRNISNRALDVVLFQPTCVIGLLTEEYSAVLLSGANGAPLIAEITVSSSGISFQERGTLNYGSVYDFGAAMSVSGSCSSGLMNLLSSGTLYSNGKLMLWKTGTGDLYMGAIKSNITTVAANLQLRQYKKYEQLDNGATDPSNTGSTFSSPSAGQLVIDSDASPSNSTFGNSSGSTTMKGFASTSRNYGYSALGNGYSTSTARTTRSWSSITSDAPFFGFTVDTLGASGKAFSVMAMFQAKPISTITFNDGTTAGYRHKGSGAVMIHFQQ